MNRRRFLGLAVALPLAAVAGKPIPTGDFSWVLTNGSEISFRDWGGEIGRWEGIKFYESPK